METICIQIGNTDNKLTQQDWNLYVHEVKRVIDSIPFANKGYVHFFGGSATWENWQNVCWVIQVNKEYWDDCKKQIVKIRKHWQQDSVAILGGETKFI